jgi:hypothetical protein
MLAYPLITEQSCLQRQSRYNIAYYVMHLTNYNTSFTTVGIVYKKIYLYMFSDYVLGI